MGLYLNINGVLIYKMFLFYENDIYKSKVMCISTMQTHACTCLRMVKLRMVENDQKNSKMSKRVLFSSCTREAHVKKFQTSDQLQGVNQLLGVTPNR